MNTTTDLTLFDSQVAQVVSLNEPESRELHYCEGIIQTGLKTFYEVGNALATIRDNRLYRAEHSTFEHYCQAKWDMTKKRANQLISTSHVCENIHTMGTIVPIV